MKILLFTTYFGILLLDFTSAECQTSLTATEQAVLDFHNELRRLHQDTPDVCYGMSDSTHKFFPQEWSEYLGKQRPEKARHSDAARQGLLGENIYWDRKRVISGEVSLKGIKKWYDEIFQYDFENITENKDRNIGHMTQLVWRGTKEIRCARSFSYREMTRVELQTKGLNRIDGTFVVCHYWPKGNIGYLLQSEVKPWKDEKALNKTIISEIKKEIVKEYRKQRKLEQEEIGKKWEQVQQERRKEAEENEKMKKMREDEKIKKIKEDQHLKDVEEARTKIIKNVALIIVVGILPILFCIAAIAYICCCCNKRIRPREDRKPLLQEENKN